MQVSIAVPKCLMMQRYGMQCLDSAKYASRSISSKLVEASGVEASLGSREITNNHQSSKQNHKNVKNMDLSRKKYVHFGLNWTCLHLANRIVIPPASNDAPSRTPFQTNGCHNIPSHPHMPESTTLTFFLAVHRFHADGRISMKNQGKAKLQNSPSQVLSV